VRHGPQGLHFPRRSGAVLVGLLMPVPGQRKAEATQSRIETIDIKN
jgi:hypothetical protein